MNGHQLLKLVEIQVHLLTQQVMTLRTLETAVFLDQVLQLLAPELTMGRWYTSSASFPVYQYTSRPVGQ